MGIGEHICRAMARQGIDGKSLAAHLGVSKNAVYAQLDRDNVHTVTVERYATALTTILHERGDSRRFTAESLMRGPDPEPPPNQAIIEALPMKPPVGDWLGEVLQVKRYSAAWCDAAPIDTDDEESYELYVIPKRFAGPGATEENTCVVVARGRSMVGDGIHPGDDLVVRTDIEQPRPGSVLVVRVSGGGPASVKRLAQDGHTLIGVGASGTTTAVEVCALDRVDLIGVVVYVGHGMLP